jgi:hypothetical protein
MTKDGYYLSLSGMMDWFFSYSSSQQHYLQLLRQHHTPAIFYTPHDYLHRMLQSNDTSSGFRGIVLPILFSIVLGFGFVGGFCYFVRLQCEERNARRWRDLEMNDISATTNNDNNNATPATRNNNIHNNDNNNEVNQSRVVRKKHREERRARILQLLTPVRVVCTYNIYTLAEYRWNIRTVPLILVLFFDRCLPRIISHHQH